MINLPFPEYLQLERLSAHGLLQLERSAAHYQNSMRTKTQPTAAQQLGTLAHLAILEPDEFAARAHVAPAVDRRTKAGKAEYAAFQACMPDGAIISPPEMHQAALGMASSVHHHKYAKALLSSGKAEQTALYERDGIPCKARPDWLPDDLDVIVDLKTAQDASPGGFAKAAGRYSYHVQAAWYIDALERMGLGRRRFLFLVVESAAPFAVSLYELDDEALDAASQRIDAAIGRYNECAEAGVWPGYDEDIHTLQLPTWSL